jgi:hypothetical protein
MARLGPGREGGEVLAASGGISECRDAGGEDAGDFAGRESPRCWLSDAGKVGADAEAGCAGVERRELSNDFDLAPRDAEFFLGLTQRRLAQRCVAGLVSSAWEADLVAVQAERATQDERDLQLIVRVAEDGDENGGGGAWQRMQRRPVARGRSPPVGVWCCLGLRRRGSRTRLLQEGKEFGCCFVGALLGEEVAAVECAAPHRVRLLAPDREHVVG